MYKVCFSVTFSGNVTKYSVSVMWCLVTFQENHSRRNVFEKLQQYAFPLSHKLPLFAFEYSETLPENGWTVLEPIAELKRMVSMNRCWLKSRLCLF
jgi:hypothetical protein